jgi:transmembrane sensor
MNARPQCDINGSIRRQAAEWLVRRDRGLSAQESIEFELWLAADERHAAAIERSRSAWTMLDRIPDEFGHDTIARAARRRWARHAILWTGLAMAAAFAVVLTPLARRAGTPPTEASAGAVKPEWVSPQIVTLSDGTLVRLNAGSEVREQFTAGERRVHLLRGEAHFTVTKSPARPFVVRAGTVEARAVGTAFNVNLQSGAVEILVTEGTVAVSGGRAGRGASLEPERDASAESVSTAPHASRSAMDSVSDVLLKAGQRVIVALTPISTNVGVVVTELTIEEVDRALAWQEPLLRLSGATLADLAAEFQRRTGYRLLLADPQLAELRTGGRFRGDDVEGFVRILEENYGIKAETRADGTIVLRLAAPPRRN